MPRYDIGPRGYHQAQAVATLAFTPQLDRAAVVTDLIIDKVSASDTWIVSTNGKELARFDIRTTGNQQPLAGPYSGYPKNNHLFDIYEYLTGNPLIYPVPMGQTITVSSLGGATANVTFEYYECDNSELSVGMINHPQGRRTVTLLTGFRNAAVTAAGENALDTQVGPLYFPNLFVDGILPTNWRIQVLAMFLEGGGRNTYSGTADHQSTTAWFVVLKNGMRYYTRDALGGLPLVGQASAAGSANTVVGSDLSLQPPIQETNMFDWKPFPVPFTLEGGSGYQFRLDIAGDVTGGADYSAMRQAFLVDVVQGG